MASARQKCPASSGARSGGVAKTSVMPNSSASVANAAINRPILTGASYMADRYAEIGDIRLHYVEEGEGPLVVMLHGFPELWFSWRRQIPALAKAGYRVI